MPEQMSVQNLRLANLVSGRYFVIPDYQRHYTWGGQQCADLVDDILAIDLAGSQGRFMGYITGIEIATKRHLDRTMNELQRIDLVDGQQRMTSLSLLMAALVYVMRKTGADGEATARTWLETYLRTPLHAGGELTRVLVQNVPEDASPGQPRLIRTYFDYLITFNPDLTAIDIVIPAQRRLKDARDYFVKRLEEIRQRYGVKGLEDFYTRLTGRLNFVLNIISSVAQAGDVFEGLNNRGKPLSQLESLKSYAAYVLHASFPASEPLVINGDAVTRDETIARFNISIAHIYHSFDRVGLFDEGIESRFLSVCWCLVIDSIAEAELSEDVPPAKFNPENPVQDYRRGLSLRVAIERRAQRDLVQVTDKVLTRLVDASRWFADARRPLHERSYSTLTATRKDVEEIRALGQRLVTLEVTDVFAPLVLACRFKYADDAGKLLELLRLLERLAFLSYYLSGKRTSFNARAYTELARALVADQIGWEQLLETLAQVVSSSGSISVDVSENKTIRLQSLALTRDEIADRAKSLDIGSEATPIVLYEWLWAKDSGVRGMTLTKYWKTFRAAEAIVAVVPPPRRGITPPEPFAALESKARTAYSKSIANIYLTAETAKSPGTELEELNSMQYGRKRSALIELGVSEDLLPRTWSKRGHEARETEIADWAVERWK